MSDSRRVLILGGGISGLTAAFWLKRAGVPVDLFEAADGPGGTMKTIHDNGWLVETGPNSALETTPLFNTMFEALGIVDDRVYANPVSDKRFIVRNGDLQVLPMKPVAFLKSRLWTTRGKLRLLREPFVGRGRGEETVAAFVARRLGGEFLDYAINPFVAGVYAGDPARLSVQSAFPKLYALERDYGGLVRGMIGGARARKRRAEKAKDRARMFSFANGMQSFPDAIARQIGEVFHGGHEARSVVECIDKDGRRSFVVSWARGAQQGEYRADVIIVAVPAATSAALVRSVDPAVASALESVYYPPVAQVFLGYDASSITRPLDGFGYLVPEVERRSILGTIWSSSLFSGRSPDGCVALTSFVGGARQPEIVDQDDESLAAITHREISSLLGVSANPVYQRIVRWSHAIPQYNLGYGRVMAAIDQAEREHPGLFFCANYRGGIAVGDCIMSAESMARRVAAFLQ